MGYYDLPCFEIQQADLVTGYKVECLSSISKVEILTLKSAPCGRTTMRWKPLFLAGFQPGGKSILYCNRVNWNAAGIKPVL